MDSEAATDLPQHDDDVQVCNGNLPRQHRSSSDVAMSGDETAYNGDRRNESDIIGSIHMRPIFFGNLSAYCNVEDIEDIFHRPVINIGGPISVDRVDLKRGFCFVFLRDAKTLSDKDRTERYVSQINGMDIPKVSKALRSEFARGDGRIKRKEDDRRKRIIPSETLFVVNFHEETTKREDLEMLFSPYGELVRIDMKRNYAFVQFTSVENATKAKDATNGGKLDQSVITVEYVAQRMGEARDRWRERERSDRGYRGRDYSRGGYRRSERNDYFRRDRGDEYRASFYESRDRSPPRDRYDDYRSRGRSRSRSPIHHYRSRSPSPRRERDAYRGGGRGVGFGEYRVGRGRSRERGDRGDYRNIDRGWSSEREYHHGDIRGK